MFEFAGLNRPVLRLHDMAVTRAAPCCFPFISMPALSTSSFPRGRIGAESCGSSWFSVAGLLTCRFLCLEHPAAVPARDRFRSPAVLWFYPTSPPRPESRFSRGTPSSSLHHQGGALSPERHINSNMRRSGLASVPCAYPSYRRALFTDVVVQVPLHRYHFLGAALIEAGVCCGPVR
jgi:hypothetical protein